jgi:hypothetical protein
MDAQDPKSNPELLAWGLETLLDRKPEDVTRVDDFLVAVEDVLQAALSERLADVCAAMDVPFSNEFEVMTDFELPPAGPEGDWAEAAALVDLGKGELHLSLELYREIEDDAPAGQAVFLVVRLLPTELWDEDELATFAAMLAEDDDEGAEAAEPGAPEAEDDEDDDGDDLALIVELSPEDAPRLAELAQSLLNEWIDAWTIVRGA